MQANYMYTVLNGFMVSLSQIKVQLDKQMKIIWVIVNTSRVQTHKHTQTHTHTHTHIHTHTHTHIAHKYTSNLVVTVQGKQMPHTWNSHQQRVNIIHKCNMVPILLTRVKHIIRGCQWLCRMWSKDESDEMSPLLATKRVCSLHTPTLHLTNMCLLSENHVQKKNHILFKTLKDAPHPHINPVRGHTWISKS